VRVEATLSFRLGLHIEGWGMMMALSLGGAELSDVPILKLLLHPQV
jgi:hypothetical protein